jgi:hypothetical protein
VSCLWNCDGVISDFVLRREAVERCTYCGEEVTWKTTLAARGSIALQDGLSDAMDPTKFSDASAGFSPSRIRIRMRT